MTSITFRRLTIKQILNSAAQKKVDLPYNTILVMLYNAKYRRGQTFYFNKLKYNFEFCTSQCLRSFSEIIWDLTFQIYWISFDFLQVIQSTTYSIMGTCMACAKTTRGNIEIEHRYIENNVATQIQQELKSTAVSTDIPPTSLTPTPAPAPAQTDSIDQDDLVLQVEEGVDKTEMTKSTKGNKSRFYHQKQNGEGSPCEETVNLQQKDDDVANHEKVVVANMTKSKRGSRRSSTNSQTAQIQSDNAKQYSESSVTSNYYSYSKDPNCLYSQKLPPPCGEGLTAQDEYIISLAEKYTEPTLIQQEVRFSDQSVYNGEWMSGMKHGKGTLTWDQNQYQGDWKFNKFWGKGLLTFKNRIVYEGEMKDHAAEGLGELRLPDSSYYRGNWENNKQNGFGVHEWSKKQRYQGGWCNGLKHGEGYLTFDDGSYYKGSFVFNQIHGSGQYHYHAKMTYKGEWEHNEKCGKGQLLLVNGDHYEGNFNHDKMHGQGKYFQADGIVYQGNWINGKREGPFICTAPDGKTSKSQWYYGKLIRSLEEQQRTAVNSRKK